MTLPNGSRLSCGVRRPQSRWTRLFLAAAAPRQLQAQVRRQAFLSKLKAQESPNNRVVPIHELLLDLRWAIRTPRQSFGLQEYVKHPWWHFQVDIGRRERRGNGDNK